MPLVSELRAAPDRINSRKSDKEAGLFSLAESIAELGLLQPLAVRETDKGYEVIDGHRRFAAIKQLIKDKRLPKNYDVPVHVLTAGEATATAASLAANIERVPLHPVDRYESFAALRDAGMEVHNIAATFGIMPRQVLQALALGKMHETIREAWRNGRLSEDAARCYANVEPIRQIEVYEKLTEQNRAHDPWIIKRELHNDVQDVSRKLMRVGLETYQAAGGKASQDLFDTDQWFVSDPHLLAQLYDDHIEALCEALRQKGYAFVWRTSDPRLVGLPYDARLYSFYPDECYDQDDEEHEEFDCYSYLLDDYQGDRSKVGFSLTIDYYDNIIVSPYRADIVLKTTESEVEADDDTAPEQAAAETDSHRISGALADTVAQWRTTAFRNAYARSPNAMLTLLIAAAGSNYCGAVVFNGALRTGADPWQTTIGKIVGAGMPVEGMLAHLAIRYAGTVQTAGLDADDVASLAEPLDPAMLREELVARFDAEQYFERATKTAMIAALAEMPGVRAELPPKLTKLECAKWTAKHAVEHGWLPPLMRVPGMAVTQPVAAETAEAA